MGRPLPHADALGRAKLCAGRAGVATAEAFACASASSTGGIPESWPSVAPTQPAASPSSPTTTIPQRDDLVMLTPRREPNASPRSGSPNATLSLPLSTSDE